MKPLPQSLFLLRSVFAAVLLLATASVSTHAASAVFSGIDIAGSDKGLALTLSADAPFAMSVTAKGPGKNGMAAVVSVRCQGAIYGLDELSFTEFPANCPVRRMAVSENTAANSLELFVGMNIVPDKQIQAKQKGNRWIILLSHEAVPSAFSWSSTPPAPPAANPQPVAQVAQGALDNGQSRLTDVTLMTRDRVERLTFQFDRPTVMRLKRESDRVVVLFVNATSNLAAQRLTPPSSPLSSIDLKQVAHGGTMWLGASIYTRQASSSGMLLEAFSDHLVVSLAADSAESLTLWSARQGTTVSHPFVKIPQFEVDYRSMEEKARTDLAGTVSGASTFAVRENERQPEKAAVAPAAEQRESVPQAVAPVASPVASEPAATVRVLVVKNSVNLRAGPSSGDSILGRLAQGTAATLMEKRDGWSRISAPQASGWVSSAMVIDSGRAPRELLDKAAELRARRLKAVFAAEAAAKLAAQKEKLLEEQKAQKQKLAEEQEAKKQAARDAKEKLALEQKAAKQAQQELAAKTLAARGARDSVLRYNAAQQDSIEKAKRKAGPQLVEYHVYGRDPFLPLSRDKESPVADVEDLNLVGILYDQTDRIGLFEDKQDKTRAFALRENDPVQNGYVLRVQPDKVLFLINELGISRTYALKLAKEKQ